MTDDEREGLAAEYVLGTLDSEQRARVDEMLASDADMRSRIERWMEDLSGLEPTPHEAPPPAHTWEAIEARIRHTFPAGTDTQRLNDGAWHVIAPGVRRKILHEDAAQRVHSFLLRLEPGAVLPSHGHEMDEECVVLEGELRIGSLRVGPGDFHIARAGAEHPAILVEVPTLIYLRGEIRSAM